MQQRQLRLGDILDDYCPRERRVTNHAVVAMVGLEVKQTRCTTCDAEHDYKGGKPPQPRRKKDAPPALYKQVLTGLSKGVTSAPAGADGESEPPAPESFDSEPDRSAGEEEGPVHRPLIRATLPRVEGTATSRQIPEFTVRQNGGRLGKFRTGAPHRHRAGGASGGHVGGGPRHVGRPGMQAGRGGNRPPSLHQHRPAHHPHARVARPGKKRSG